MTNDIISSADPGISHRRKISKKFLLHICLILFFAVSVLIPLIFMFCNITAKGLHDTVTSAQFASSVRNSILTALTATSISLALAMAAAFCIERTAIKGKGLFGILFVIPMLIPSISHAFGLVSLFGFNGIVTNLFHWNFKIYGFWGIVLGAVMYSFPVAFLMISGILRYEDSMPYKAAQILGISRTRRFFAITLPYLKKTLISTFFAVFTMIVTDYGVPLMVGGKMTTLSVLMYNKAVTNADYNVGSVIGLVLLIPAVIAFLIDLFSPENGQNGFVSELMETENKKTIKGIAYTFCILISVFILLPILSFCAMVFETKYPVDTTFTWQHIVNTVNRGAGEYLLNSVVYAVLVAILGTALSFLCAYATARVKGKLSRPLHLISMTSMAIPGIVLGLSYLLFFNNTFIYGTIFIIVLVNSLHFFSSPYLMIYNTLSKLNPNLEDVGISLGISKVRIVFNVIIPKVAMTLLEMFVYFFVNSMMTISAVSFLAPPAPKSVALMITQFESQLLMESAAFVSLLILFVNLAVKGIMTLIKKKKCRE